MLDKVARIGWLNEIYGGLLTDKQKKLVNLYYYDDLSLAEIADELQISRQAVFFGLKRSESLLEDYEEKLRLFERFIENRKQLEEILKNLKCYRDSEDKKYLDLVQEKLEDFIDNDELL